MPNNLLAVREVAALAGVRPETIHAYLHRGKMPPPDLTISRSPVWRRRTIERWLKTRAPRKRIEVRTTLPYRRIGPAGHYESTVTVNGKPTRIAIVLHPGSRSDWDWLVEDLDSGQILAGGEVPSLHRAKQKAQDWLDLQSSVHG